MAAENLAPSTMDQIRTYGPIRKCYQDFAGDFTNPSPKAGELVMLIKIDETGILVGSKTDDKASTLHDEKLISCVLQAMQTMKFTDEVHGKSKVANLVLKFPLKKE